ncbi:MAG: hypothetical protein K1060chlam5_00270 [Candidatus Anoxychlamydiales bacterium]|nr:hypothetical protein [Candidatus Anoxychlamydiales bacterium]
MVDQENYKILLSHVYNMIFLMIIILIISSIAYFKGFCKLDKKIKIPVTFFQMITGFFLYILISIGLAPIIAKYLNLLNENARFTDLNILSFFINLFTFLSLMFFGIKIKRETFKSIIKVKYKNSKSIKYDIIIGILSWIIIFPIVIFTTELLEMLLLVFFNIVETPDQLAVKYLKMALSSPVNLIIAITSISIFAPIIEEFLFRGLLQNYLNRFFKRAYAIIITSLAFTFFHFALSQGLGNITIIGSIFVLSLFLGYIYEKQKSLYASIFLHFTFNSINIINLIFFKGV